MKNFYFSERQIYWIIILSCHSWLSKRYHRMKSNTRCFIAFFIVLCMTVFSLYYFYWKVQGTRSMIRISHWNHKDTSDGVKYTNFKRRKHKQHIHRPEISLTGPTHSMVILDYSYIYTNLNRSLEEFPIFVYETSPFEKNSRAADCLIIADRNRMREADAVVFRHSISNQDNYVRPRSQRYVLFTMESPQNTENFTQNGDQVTATYIKDSSILLPYETFNR